MKRMTRMATKKSYSWWWDSHVSPKNSKWLEDNLVEMDCCVKGMLKLIEEEGDSFAKKAEMYYKRRPELIAHVKDFYRMYRALAERYDNVTGELRRNIPSELHSQGSGSGSDFGSEPASPSILPSPELTPESKPPRPKPGSRAAGFDFFLGTGGSSDHSRKGSDGSSSCPESDSDDSKDANADNASSMLHQRILMLENELLDMKEKFSEYEGKDYDNRCSHPGNTDHVDYTSSISALEKNLVAAEEKLHVAEAEISRLMQKIAKNNSSSEVGCVDLNLKKKQAPELEEPIEVMEIEISHYKQEIENLKVALMSANQRLAANLSDCNNAIEECKAEVSSLTKTYVQDKSRIETEIMEQEHIICELQSNASSSAKQFLQYKCALKDQVSGLSQSCASLEAKIISLEDVIKLLEAETTRLCAQYGKHTEELNRNIDALKLNIDMLTSEKKELGDKVSRLVINVRCRDGRISEINKHLHRLHLEHMKLITGIEEARELAKSCGLE